VDDSFRTPHDRLIIPGLDSSTNPATVAAAGTLSGLGSSHCRHRAPLNVHLAAHVIPGRPTDHPAHRRFANEYTPPLTAVYNTWFWHKVPGKTSFSGPPRLARWRHLTVGRSTERLRITLCLRICATARSC